MSAVPSRRLLVGSICGVLFLGLLAFYIRSEIEEAWLPPGAPEEAGRVLLQRKRCMRCHRIAGVGGRAGPDLTLVATRHPAAWLDQFMLDPVSVDPRSVMPLPRLNDAQRAAVVAYLMTLDGRSDPSPPTP